MVLIKYHYTSISIAKVTKVTRPNAGKDVEKLDLSFIAGTSTLENSLTVSFMTKKNLYCTTTMKVAQSVRSSNCTAGHLSQVNENLCPHKNLCMIVHSNFVSNSPNWKQPQCPSVG